MLFEPVVGVALAAWLLSEGLAPIQVIGGLAILGAALILQRTTTPGERLITAAAVEWESSESPDEEPRRRLRGADEPESA
jgi:hypothetical protein